MTGLCWRAERTQDRIVTFMPKTAMETRINWGLTMPRKLTAAVLLVLSLAGTTAASAQTAYDYWRDNWTGRGQCYHDEGYGRYSPCDSGQ
jgi:hypothetical protein